MSKEKVVYTFYEEFECCTVSLQYMPTLNVATVTAHFDLGLLRNDAHKQLKVLCVKQ